MNPVLKINGNDYTKYVLEDGLSITRNDLDADGSGRNILDGTMYRSRIATKITISVKLVDHISESVYKALLADLYSGENYVSVTFLDALTDTQNTLTMYCSTINDGNQYRRGGATVYDGVSFEVIER